MSWNSLPNVGQSLLLDFLKPKVLAIKDVESSLNKIVKSMNYSVLNSLAYDVEDSNVLFLQTSFGSIQATAHTKSEMLTVEVKVVSSLQSEYSAKIASNFETALCDEFGWENNTGNSIVGRGGSHYHLLNKYYHSETMYKNFKLIHREQTKFQDLRIYDSKEMGRVLSLDYMIQNSDSLTEDSYTIDLCSLVLKKDKSYDTIMLIGAGDMIIPTYILKNFQVKKIVMVEIDDRVIENTKKYFKFYELVEGFIKDGRLEVNVDDGAAFLKNAVSKGVKYDGIIIDNSDVYLFEGPAANLFTKEFYSNIFAGLNSKAVFSQQVSDDVVKEKWTNMVKSVGFEDLHFINSLTPEYSTALPLGSAIQK